MGHYRNTQIKTLGGQAKISYHSPQMKNRLDKLLVEQGYTPSRERAQALILAGRVLVDEQKVEKPGTPVDESAALRILGEEQRYVSRGGFKLEAALEKWQIALDGRACVDIGTSTGGFTDCMLQHGAASVVAVDTGYGQIAENLRRDARVSLLERTNARYLKPGDLPAGIDFVSMDVSFISATLVLPAVLAAVRQKQAVEAVILVKPQFEAGREHIGKGGIVRDPAAHQLAIDRVRAAVQELGASVTEIIDSPILGGKGNREFLLYARFAG
jgi:23S rRNA (cytidine1920-2'-O)/16S rRNA (cytidine1409-2'-O)-methyltransferase